jgi:hypothetical protein
MVRSLAGAIGLCERNPVGVLLHVAVEQIVYSGEHQSVDHKGSCANCEFRQDVGIHKVSWDGFLNSFICWGTAETSLDQCSVDVVSLLRTLVGTGAHHAVGAAILRNGMSAR